MIQSLSMPQSLAESPLLLAANAALLGGASLCWCNWWINGTAALLGGASIFWYHFWLIGPILHISTGEQRRALFPKDKGIGPGAQEALEATDVSIRRDYFVKANGEKIFYQFLEPADQAPTHMVVFIHGYMSNSEFHVENMLKFVRRGAMVVMPDLPCHGRSDGLLYYTPDWWALVRSMWEFLDAVVEPLRASLSNPDKVFAHGTSLGGGLVACLAIQRPVYFEGIILTAPMLFVSDEIKPSKLVQQVFKNVLGPLQLPWPVTPTSEMEGTDFENIDQGRAWTRANPFAMGSCKPRLATAKELGFTFPDWMSEHMSQLRTPFIVLHSRNDKMTDPKMSERLHEEASAVDKTIRLCDGEHCEHFYCTPGNAKLIGMEWSPVQMGRAEQYFKDIFEWMADRL